MNRAPLFLLYLNVLVIATCGLIYELMAGTLASYLLGDSVTQFSLVIGIYLSALGVGAWLSRFIERGVARTFIEVELGVALLGGLSAPVLFLAFAEVESFRVLLFSLVFAIGVLVGLELPLLMRLLKEHLDFSDLVSQVLTFDYIGALFASLLFPIVLVPYLGLVRTSLVFGVLNALVGLWGTYLLHPLLNPRHIGGLRGRAILVTGILVAGVIKADSITTLAEERYLEGEVVYSVSSRFQRIVVTSSANGFQLYLNGHLQFNSVDEYRYHEALVHPALGSVTEPRRVLVLGGGDGLAVREVLKYPRLESVTLVDLDPEMTGLSRKLPPLLELNAGALEDSRVQIVNADAFLWLQEQSLEFDAAIIDFPDPSSYSVGKLYSRLFFKRLRKLLAPHAAVAIQCTSPLVAPQSYWCVINTMESAGFQVRPYHATVPTFGVWGFALASLAPTELRPTLSSDLEGQLRFLNREQLQEMFVLPGDISRVDTKVNLLNDQVLVRYYDQEWSEWN